MHPYQKHSANSESDVVTQFATDSGTSTAGSFFNNELVTKSHTTASENSCVKKNLFAMANEARCVKTYITI
jgi:hypothetical protein